MQIADIMTRSVIAVSPDTPLAQAILLMTERNVSGLPVLDAQGGIVGIVTEGDLLRRIEIGTAGDPPGWLASLFLPGREAKDYIATHGRRVGEVMTTDPVTITEEADLSEAVRLMQHHHVKRLPVVRAGRLSGVVSRRDLIRTLGNRLAQQPGTADDAAIEQAIAAGLAREPWAGPEMARVTVRDGVVEIDGCVFNMDERQALTVLVENIPGVKGVNNRVVCVEPTSGALLYDPSVDKR